MPSLFNAWYLVNGRLMQVDDFLERGPYRKPVDEVDTPMTIRFRFEKADYDPTGVTEFGVWSKVEGYDDLGNIWDWTATIPYRVASAFSMRLTDETNLVDIIGTGDFSGLDGYAMNSTFYGCTSLRSVSGFYIEKCTQANSLFSSCTNLIEADISLPTVNMTTSMFSNCTSLRRVTIRQLPDHGVNASAMFMNCTGLTEIPNIDTSGMSVVSAIFNGCNNIQHGAMAMYEQMTTQPNVPVYGSAFLGCGINTVSGLSDLINIPVSWGGKAVASSMTLRFRFSDPNYDPSTKVWPSTASWAHRIDLALLGNVWEFTYDNYSWYQLFSRRFTDPNNEVEVIGAGSLSNLQTAETLFEYCTALKRVTCPLNLSNVTHTYGMFGGCTKLESVPDFDLSNVISSNLMFAGCTALKTVPTIVVSSTCNISGMFAGCTSVESGALALYQKLSTQEEPPITHEGCFSGCGVNTSSGRAELAQIPESWGGTMPDSVEDDG